MKKTVLALFLLFVWNAYASADVPKYISFQGELTDSQGTRITSSKSVTFKLHTAASGGAILWSEVQTLTPGNGIVSAIVGAQTTGGVSLAFDTQYWLGVTVSPDAEMSPRVRLTTSPYAFIAKFLDTGAVAHGALTVAETVTAGNFVGNGSALTGVTASNGAPDTDWSMTGGMSGNLYRLSGNVGIGTMVPGGKLHVAGNVIVKDTFVVQDTALVVNEIGDVGIGTAIPMERLHVKGGSDGTRVQIESLSGTTNAAAVFVNPDRTWSAGCRGDNNDVFGIADDSAGLYRLVIDTSGNVGIGTTNPTGLFQVGGAIFTALSSGNVGIGGTAPASKLSVSGGGSFGAGYSGTAAPTGGLIIAGNVGIGTTAPGYALDVAGSINVTADIRKNGTAYTYPDYVFEPGYTVMPLQELKAFLEAHKHLPGVPSTAEVRKDGVKLFEQNRVLLEKLEEAYLYLLHLDGKTQEQEGRMQAQIDALKSELTALKNQGR